MSLREKLNKSEFVITGELCPPKGNDVSDFLKKADLVKDCLDAVNVTDNQRAFMRLSSLAASILLVQKGIEPVYQVTCRDRNRISLQSDLLGASVFGIENILIVTGDYVTCGDHPDAKPVFDVESAQLVKIVSDLNKGIEAAGNSIEGKTKFLIGAVVNPGADPVEPQLARFEQKVKCGAQFFQTQAVYDMKKYEKFFNWAKKFDVKILAGVLLLKSAKMARFLNKNVAGVNVPDKLIKELEVSDKPSEKGIEIAARQIKEISSFGHGVHIMTVGKEEAIIDIVKKFKDEN